MRAAAVVLLILLAYAVVGNLDYQDQTIGAQK